jgi:hypothetical protein
MKLVRRFFPALNATQVVALTREVIPVLTSAEVVESIQGFFPELDVGQVVGLLRKFFPELDPTLVIALIQEFFLGFNVTKMFEGLQKVFPELKPVSVVTQILKVHPEFTASQVIELIQRSFPLLNATQVFDVIRRLFRELTATGAVQLVHKVLLCQLVKEEFPPWSKKVGSFDVHDGVIAHLTREYGGNVHDHLVVDVTCGPFEKETEEANPHSGAYNNHPSCVAKNPTDLETDSIFFSAYHLSSHDIPHMKNNWGCYEFTGRKTVPTHYTIRRYGYPPGSARLKS